ncbi:MAG: aliphatic sulfonate ABC transporter substrate-binding protein [Lachnospiraceae bacterium]|nr:aliphatic sulfonate ABC transporter substrate-binding protein [Lachnospiraceae bacterium]
MKQRAKKLLTLTIAATASLSLLAGCGQSSADSSTAAADSEDVEESSVSAEPEEAEAAASSDTSDVTVKIGTMDLVNGDLIARYEDLYEQQLGVDVEIVSFDSGSDVNTALASGSIDISELGSSPTALGISNGLEYEVIWIGDVIGSAETLVATEESGVTSVEDLAGKTVATPFASTAHYSLLNALELAGLSETDVTVLDMQPDDIYAAWLRGDIDAAYVWYPVLSELQETGVNITDSAQLADQGIITADLVVARTEFAEQYPEIVENYIKVQIQANEVLLDDPETAATEIASVLEISEEDAADQITQYVYLKGEEQADYLNDYIADALKATADFLVEQQSITSAPDLETFVNSINTSYLEAALAE